MLALAGTASTATATPAETGKLTFHSELAWRGHRVDCPAGTPASVVCRQHEGSGVIPGLGAVTERYLFLNQTGTAECPGNYRVLALSIQFIVGTKGTIQITSAPSTDCMPEGQAVTLNFPSFTITGGSGIYSGASGTGTFRKLLRPASAGAFPEPGMAIGKDIWDGTVLVPGLAFDTTAPVLRGAVTKTVVAARGREACARQIPSFLRSTRRTAQSPFPAGRPRAASSRSVAPSSPARPLTGAGTPGVLALPSLSEPGDRDSPWSGGSGSVARRPHPMPARGGTRARHTPSPEAASLSRAGRSLRPRPAALRRPAQADAS